MGFAPRLQLRDSPGLTPVFPVTAPEATSPALRYSIHATIVTDPPRLLLLGGTTEAGRLAEVLCARDDLVVVTSLAGRTASPGPLPGRRRTGGFGGAQGLATYLRAERISALVDATHPFAARMRWHAYEACNQTGVPRLRLERPPWQAQAGDRWTIVTSVAAAAEQIARGRSRRVFVTTGRGELVALAPASDGRRRWLVRCLDPPERLPLHPAEVILDRGPFSVDGETALLVRHRIDLVVTKNSGGDAAAAKLEAARNLGVAVLVIDRPPSPEGPSATTVAGALEWVRASFGLSAQSDASSWRRWE
jgi:precorrin-6A/cobalt-precorrin-6A reductase